MAGVKMRWPWQAKETVHKSLQAPSETNTFYEHTDEHIDEDENRFGEKSSPAPSRWVSESSDISPYGFSDEDGGLRQVESGAWRRAFTGGETATRRPSISRTQRFVARSSSPARPSRPSESATTRKSSLSGTLVWQTFCAALLVGAAYFVTHDQKPLANSISSQAQTVFDTDYTATVAPVVSQAVSDLHVKIPSIGTSSAAKLHMPISGSITADYGSNHPEIWISAKAGAPVMSAGSGNVLTVVKSGQTTVVKIDNGKFGTSIYAGLGSVNVKTNEYVTAGEVIGKLPTTPSHPDLRFSMVKGGQYENPHQFIHFSGGNG